MEVPRQKKKKKFKISWCSLQPKAGSNKKGRTLQQRKLAGQGSIKAKVKLEIHIPCRKTEDEPIHSSRAQITESCKAVSWFVPGMLEMKVQANTTNFRDHLMVAVSRDEALFASPSKGGKGW